MHIVSILLLVIPLAIAPGVAIAFFIYFRDKFDKEPFKLIRNCFLFGMLSILPAMTIEIALSYTGINENGSAWKTLLYAIFVVGLAEEMSKFLFLRTYVYRKPDFNYPFDGIVYAIMISMGFATIENIMYAANGGTQAALLRMFTAVPLHAVCAIFMGYYAGKAKFSKHKTATLILGIIIAVVVHGLYDFFLFQQEIPYLAIFAFVTLGVSVGFSFIAINKLRKISAIPTEPEL
ncbi:MAG: PrsW family glutamic-type intramembrane protease [Bacteroidota bacterium]